MLRTDLRKEKEAAAYVCEHGILSLPARTPRMEDDAAQKEIAEAAAYLAESSRDQAAGPSGLTPAKKASSKSGKQQMQKTKASRTGKAKGGGGLGGDSLTDARDSSDAASSAARPRKRLKGPLSDSRAQGGLLAAGKGQGMLQGRAEPSTPGPSNT
ncbi:hypothetical protein JCM8202_004215 [Rhodotorula sphaerocarpa]